MKDKKIANIHQALTGKWYITDESLDYVSEGGNGYGTHRKAIKAARDGEYWTHYVNRTGKIVKL
tara:strand:+ start:357 stop:548 length:192 start_codon:yes stop_codon:yes gene_type:complete